MKQYGFHPGQIYFKMRNSMKVRKLNSEKMRDFEAPIKTSEKILYKIHDAYQRRLDFEKYLSHKGVEPTILSRFKRFLIGPIEIPKEALLRMPVYPPTNQLLLAEHIDSI